MAIDQEMAARLREARGRWAGYPGPTAAMKAFGFGSGYYNHENGSRDFVKHVSRYAHAYKVREEWLQYGRGNPRDGARRALVSGEVGQFGTITSDKTNKMSDALEDYVDLPPDAGEFLAYRVIGDFNYPSLFNGDVIYTRAPADPENAIGKQCVALLEDGTKRVCILTRAATAGLYLLLSINASPIPDARVIEAAPVVWIKRG